MKKIANGILADNPEENAVFMTEDGQGFFDKIKATNHANKNDFSEPQAFYGNGFEPDDNLALDEQLGFAQEENEAFRVVLGQVTQAVDYAQEAPEVTQESNEVVAAVVQLREKHQGAVNLFDQIIDALVTDEIIVDEKAEPVVVEIMKIRSSLQTATVEKETLVESLKNATTENTDLAASLKTVSEEKEALAESLIKVQSELDTLKAAAVEVKEEKTEIPTVPIAPKKAK